MSIRLLRTGVLAVAVLGFSAVGASAAQRQVIGHSVENRPITSWRQGDSNPVFKVLVVGSIHGDERQGMRVVARLRQMLAGKSGPKRIGIWTVRNANPDGTIAGTRRNARRVDLNRNFPYRWDGSLNGGYNSGPRPASEPETRAMMRLGSRVGFDLAIWFHQPWDRTLAPCDNQRRWAFLYARLSGLGTGGRCDRGRYPGSAVSWQHQKLGTTAFVVELGSAVQHRPVITRHARAVIRLARRMSR